MRAVTGTVVSSEPISVRRAAGIISNFAKADTGARPEAAAYLRRACKAFDELVQFHREIRGRHKGAGSQIQNEEREMNHKKKRKGVDGAGLEDGGDSIPVPRETERNPRLKPEREIRSSQAEGGNSGGGVKRGENGWVLGIEEDWGRKNKKMMKKKKAEEEENGSLERNSKAEKKRKHEAEEVRRHSDKEGRDVDRKKRKHSHAEEVGGLDDWSERHKQKKRRRMEMKD